MDNKIKINKSLNNILAQLDKIPVVGVIGCQRVALMANEIEAIRECVNSPAVKTEAPKVKEADNDTDNSDNNRKG